MPDTKRMTLRRAGWPDIDDLVAMGADAEVMRHHGDGAVMTAAHVLAVELPRLMADVRRGDQLGCWVARDRVTGRFLGWFALTPVEDAVQTVVLGYRLRRQARDHGYGVEGALRLLEMARSAEILTVLGMASLSDPGSRDVMEQAGLRLVAHRTEDSETSAGPTEPHHAADYRLDLCLVDRTA